MARVGVGTRSWYAAVCLSRSISEGMAASRIKRVPAALVLAFRLGRALYAAVDLVPVRYVTHVGIGEAHAEGHGEEYHERRRHCLNCDWNLIL